MPANSPEPSDGSPLAAIYRSVSTKQQDESLKTQEGACDAYCAFKRLATSPETEFHDADTSGSIPLLERPGGQTLFNAIKLRLRSTSSTPSTSSILPIKHLVVAKLDRLGRSAIDLLSTVKQLDDLGVTLHIVDMNGDTLSTQGPAGRLMFTVLAGMAEFEREMIGARVRETMDRKFNEEALIGTVPYGYNAVPTGEVTVKNGKTTVHKRLVDNPTEQQWLRQMHLWREDHRWSFHGIAAELNRRRVPTKTGKLGGWQSGNVAKALASKHTARFLVRQTAFEAAA